MPSFRAKMVNAYLRFTLKTKRLDRIDPPALRAMFEKKAIRFLPKGVERREIADGAVRGELVFPAAGNDRAVLYLHGGAYVFGSPQFYRNLTYALALAGEAAVFAPAYRLAPEHPCPAAIEDALAAYNWLLEQGWRPSEIIIAGDSAGGGLALATMLALNERVTARPGGAVLYSPWTDLSVSGQSMQTNAENDAMFQYGSIEGGRWKYLGALDPTDPRASPLFADLSNLPPLLVFASESEMLFDDASRLVERAKDRGVDVRFEARRGLAHVWPLFRPFMPEAQEAIDLTGIFIRERTASL